MAVKATPAGGLSDPIFQYSSSSPPLASVRRPGRPASRPAPGRRRVAFRVRGPRLGPRGARRHKSPACGRTRFQIFPPRAERGAVVVLDVHLISGPGRPGRAGQRCYLPTHSFRFKGIRFARYLFARLVAPFGAVRRRSALGPRSGLWAPGQARPPALPSLAQPCRAALYLSCSTKQRAIRLNRSCKRDNYFRGAREELQPCCSR